MKGPLWHCVRKNRGWVTYCGRSLERLVTPGKTEFAYHQDRGTFLAEPERQCTTCRRAAQHEERQERAQAAAAGARNAESLSSLAVFQKALQAAGL